MFGEDCYYFEYRKLRKAVEELAVRLEKEARVDLKLGKTGSPVTSMAEDLEIGAVGKFKRYMANTLKSILSEYC